MRFCEPWTTQKMLRLRSDYGYGQMSGEACQSSMIHVLRDGALNAFHGAVSTRKPPSTWIRIPVMLVFLASMTYTSAQSSRSVCESVSIENHSTLNGNDVQSSSIPLPPPSGGSSPPRTSCPTK